jgi:hypothetical protein
MGSPGSAGSCRRTELLVSARSSSALVLKLLGSFMSIQAPLKGSCAWNAANWACHQPAVLAAKKSGNEVGPGHTLPLKMLPKRSRTNTSLVTPSSHAGYVPAGCVLEMAGSKMSTRCWPLAGRSLDAHADMVAVGHATGSVVKSRCWFM